MSRRELSGDTTARLSATEEGDIESREGKKRRYIGWKEEEALIVWAGGPCASPGCYAQVCPLTP